MLLTHAYVHWLVDMQLAGFAPAFTLSFHDSECSRKPPNAHSLGRESAQKLHTLPFLYLSYRFWLQISLIYETCLTAFIFILNFFEGLYWL